MRQKKLSCSSSKICRLDSEADQSSQQNLEKEPETSDTSYSCTETGNNEQISRKVDLRLQLKELNDSVNPEEYSKDVHDESNITLASTPNTSATNEEIEDTLAQSKDLALRDSYTPEQEIAEENPFQRRGQIEGKEASPEKRKDFSTTEDEERSSGTDAAVPKTEDGVKVSDRRHWKKQQRKWRASYFDVIELEGHNDLVCDVKVADNVIVSASCDTVLKVWSIDKGKELRSLGGHSGPVTSFVILPEAISKDILTCYDFTNEGDSRVVVSGSHDCHIRLWALSTGCEFKSIYTYNPIKCLHYVLSTDLLLSATNGGKLIMWDLKTASSVKSVLIHDDIITGIQTDGDLIYTACADGELRVFRLQDGDLRTVYKSENMSSVSGEPLTCRPIHCLSCYKDILYFGDDGLNIKALNWKQGVASKLSNHLQDYGGTDALYIHNDLLLSSGYGLDSGLGYTNIRRLPEEKYMCTLNDDDTSRILCLACGTDKEGHLVVVTGGTELKLWRRHEEGRAGSTSQEDLGDRVLQPQYIRQYDRPARDSDVESDTELLSTDNSSETDTETNDPAQLDAEEDSAADNNDMPGWRAWCEIL